MSRLLMLLILVIVAAWWLHGRFARLRRPAGPATASRRATAAPQDMVACAHCGVHLPGGEAWIEDKRSYCTEEHRRLGSRLA